jgi:hypothetical protein
MVAQHRSTAPTWLRRATALRLTCAAGVVSAFVTGARAQSPPTSTPRVLVDAPRVVIGPLPPIVAARLDFRAGLARLFVSRAIAGAAERLADAECQQVLTDFDDRPGHSLRARMREIDRTPATFLQDLLFVDASDESICLGGNVAAYTTPGSRTIFVCGTRFADSTSSLQGDWGIVIVIHEMLHALGLGENPPTSARITTQVNRRCGSWCPRPPARPAR